jgi:hypothetical protein
MGGVVYQKVISSSFIENYLNLETSLQFEVRKRMSILYTFQGSEFYKNIMMNDYVNKTEKEVILKIIRKNVNKINTYLRLTDDDWEILSDEQFDNIINDYIKSRT